MVPLPPKAPWAGAVPFGWSCPFIPQVELAHPSVLTRNGGVKKYFFKNLKKGVAFCRMRDIIKHVAEVQRRGEREYADVAELADALDSGSSGSDTVGVQVPSSAPNQYNPNQFFPVGDGFGLFVYFERYENTYFPNGVIKRPESKPRGPRKRK